MSQPADAVAPAPAPGPEGEGDSPFRPLGLSPESIHRLHEAGYATVESAQALTDDQLRVLGLEPAEIARIHGTPTPAASPADSAERGVDRWVDRVRRQEPPKRRSPTPTGGRVESAEVLKKWVQGDDRAMEDWIQSAEVARPGRPSPTGSPVPVEPGPSPPSSTPTAVPAAAPSVPGGAAPTPGLPAQLVEREETVVRWLTDLLDRVKSDQFDPSELLQEIQDLHRSLFEEQAKRKQLEEELEHVKRGSIAVIKYVRSREAKARDQAIQAKDAELAELRLKLLTLTGHPEGPGGAQVPGAPEGGTGAAPAVDVATVAQATERRVRDEFEARETQALEREAELRRRIVQLEGEIRNLRSELGAAQQRDELRRKSGSELQQDLTKLMADADARERELMLRENELRTRFDEIRLATEDLERKRAPLTAKERELESWEGQLQATRQALELEAHKIEQSRQGEPPEPAVPIEELRKLERLKTEIAGKEAEMKAREAYLRQKIEELETLQRQAAGEVTERPGTASASPKVRSGVRRLDDLLFGGFPPASQMLVNGPAHTGKEILSRLFMVEGLKQNIPAVWVVTDKTYTQIRDDMTQLFPAYPDAERKGMVRYIDLYSRSLGVTQSEAGVKLLSVTDKGVLDQLNSATASATSELKEKHGGYRLVFESISTLTAYLDGAALFRFLQPFTGRRKLDGSVAYYLLETGMHSESDLQTLEHMMDGSINLKVEQLKTFLSVKGVSEVQSRAWIGYTFSKKAFSLGSFSLDHIR